MRFSFDPRNIVPLDDKGTVYPYIRKPMWGILEVEKGALIASDWMKSNTNPTDGNNGQKNSRRWLDFGIEHRIQSCKRR
jgi:hypothetical protein